MKARVILAGSLGLVLSTAGWLAHYQASRPPQILMQEPPPLSVAGSPAFADWKRLWEASNPPPNLLAQAPSPGEQAPVPLLTATSSSKTDTAEEPRQEVEAKLDQILAKLEQFEKRLEALDKRRQSGTCDKLEQILQRVNQLESRLQGMEAGEKTDAACNPFGCLLGLFPITEYSSDPNVRIRQLLNESEDIRTIREEWERIWSTDIPSHLTPERVHGAIQ
jgi:hypothetical protein